MSDAPERIAVWPDFVGHPSMTGQWSTNTHPDNAVAYVRADLSDALLREAMEALEEIEARDKLPTPSYGGVTPGQYAYVHRAGPFAEIARPTLAKLREHLGEMK